MEDGQRRPEQGGTAVPGRYDREPLIRCLRRIQATPLPLRLAAAISLVVIVGLLDSASGAEISIFYLVPVAFAGGLASRRAGTLVAILSAVTWEYIEFVSVPEYAAAWIPYWNSGVRLGFFLVVNELIDVVRRAHLRERYLSRTDALTGISNARVFEEHVVRVIAECRRHVRSFTIVYIDLDGFKRVNDTLGHSEGDRVLKTVAYLIKSTLRTSDLVARLGGDEFGIFMPDTGSEQARVPLERIAAALFDGPRNQWSVGATFGAVTFIEPPPDFDCALRQADSLMYRGKAEGRGRIMMTTWPAKNVAP